MNPQYKLKLKPMDDKDPHSLRIYDLTRKTVDDFNNYISDFFETISILKENLSKLKDDKDEQKKKEISGTIIYVEDKIEELSVRMQAIADEMSSLVEVAHHHDHH
jgi:prefoldin subunit 5